MGECYAAGLLHASYKKLESGGFDDCKPATAPTPQRQSVHESASEPISGISKDYRMWIEMKNLDQDIIKDY